MKEIEDFLRENKPVVKDNPTFILEARRRMEAVEGIKAEVDRQRCYGRLALIITLMAGLLLGVVATAIAFLISVIVNYLMCVRWVFDGAGEQGNAQRAGFLITSVIGFFLNLGLMWLFGRLFQEDLVLFRVFSFEVKMYLVSKSMATVIVMVWNYFTKRKILQK